MFGKKKRRGAQAPIFMKHSGKILRTIVKQLKGIGYLENLVFSTEEDGKKRLMGLILTKTGHTELDKVASKILRGK
jgi:ribosomal protein S19E (S16A)